jgi:hypothetical protein
MLSLSGSCLGLMPLERGTPITAVPIEVASCGMCSVTGHTTPVVVNTYSAQNNRYYANRAFHHRLCAQAHRSGRYCPAVG